MAVRCGKGHGHHENVAAVRACYNGQDVPLINVGQTPTGEDGASTKQVDYAVALLEKHALKTAKLITAYGKREISGLITLLRSNHPGQISSKSMAEFGVVPFDYGQEDGASLAPNKPRDFTDPKAVQASIAAKAFDPNSLESGIYLRDNKIYKVVKAVHGSGNMYAKLLVKGENGEKSRFTMAFGEIRNLRREHKMTLEQAKEFGPIYGCCVRCGRVLTKESSIDQFMGDWCASQF